MIEHRTKDCPAFIKAYDDEKGILKGYASVGGFPDSYGDIVEPGAFKKTLKEFKGRIRLCWQHNFREPIGKPYVLKEHDQSKLPPELLERFPDATCGLYFESHISDTAQGRDAKALLRDGVVDEMSIGFDVYPQGENLDEKGFHHLTDIILYEISPVTMAAMPAAMVTDYKGLVDIPEGKPYPNEHACRLEDPGKYDTCRRGERTADKPDNVKGKKYSVIYCKKGDGPMEQQAFRYPIETWTAAEAKGHCELNDGSFEAATGKEAEGEFIESDGDEMAWHDVKLGRVISKKNEDKLRQAAVLIGEVLSFLDEEDTEAKDQGPPLDGGGASTPALGQGESLALRIRVRQAELDNFENT